MTARLPTYFNIEVAHKPTHLDHVSQNTTETKNAVCTPEKFALHEKMSGWLRHCLQHELPCKIYKTPRS